MRNKKGQLGIGNKYRFQKGQPSLRKGVVLSEETKRKISEAKMGQVAGFLGRKHSVETIERIRRTKIKQTPTGADSHLWKGGTSRIYKTGYYSRAYKDWRRKVFERDNYTCRGCGAMGSLVYLTAHHIKSFARFVRLRFVVLNGLTLCEPCHSKTDNYKGRK